MDYRLPYYMAYPMPLLYDDDKIEKRDFEYMKSLYPMTAKTVLPYVEEECDRMEYEGSVIYDEYPDQLQIRMMGRRIYDRVKDMVKDVENAEEGEQKEGWLRELIQIMLFQELFQRRCSHRRGRRKFY